MFSAGGISGGLGIVVLSLLAGCTGLDGAELASLDPIAPSAFVYRARTDLFHGPGDDGFPEQQRLMWLRTYLGLYGMCRDGYRLTSREVIFQYQSPLGYPVADILYRGNCLG